MIRQIIKTKLDINSSDFAKYLSKINIWGFDVMKLEKDFYLTVILNRIAENMSDLIFKWWTCLNKVHFWYYRLSEDLDFVVLSDGWDSSREKLLKRYRDDLIVFMQSLWCSLQEWRTRFNSNTQWLFRFAYQSLIDKTIQEVKIDIHIQKSLLCPISKLPIKHIFYSFIDNKPIFPSNVVFCMNLDEAMAEKMRAWLTRRTPAIRDLFDIWYARSQWFDFEKIHDLIDKKIAEVGKIYTLHEHYETLQKQIKTDLEPVLWDTWLNFDFDEIFKFVLSFKR